MSKIISECILYCSREFPTKEVLSSMYLFFDKITIIPPAQTIFITHYLGNQFSLDSCLDLTNNFHSSSQLYNEISTEYKRNSIIEDYNFNRTKFLDHITLEAWQRITYTTKSDAEKINLLLDLRDSIISSIFVHANADLILQNPEQNIFRSPTSEVDTAIELAIKELPLILTNDLNYLKEIKREMGNSIESFKTFIRNERFKFLNILKKENELSKNHIIEFNEHTKYEIEKLKSTYNLKIRELHEEKDEAKFGIFGAIISGIALGLVSNPAVGLITGLLGSYNFGQKMISLANKERLANNSANQNEIGLFLKFDKIKKTLT